VNHYVFRWAVWEVDFAGNKDGGYKGSRHVVGFNAVTGRGRVSTPIKSWDPDTQTAVTMSGSTYILVGRPAADSNDNAEWHLYQTYKKVGFALDVTTDYMGQYA